MDERLLFERLSELKEQQERLLKNRRRAEVNGMYLRPDSDLAGAAIAGPAPLVATLFSSFLISFTSLV
ncbi:hypothetical protein B9T62_07010 [Paenibacillus donghaensis]|uniref:Uncharacterized protein n=1 Tax=Paenibacillus donghaensis TaxID=414771 RepID=A0A2Z2KES8_9BACL|nr:hypothetical protein B9T62_07010 [Paenibacillus donghaensis]